MEAATVAASPASMFSRTEKTSPLSATPSISITCSDVAEPSTDACSSKDSAFRKDPSLLLVISSSPLRSERVCFLSDISCRCDNISSLRSGRNEYLADRLKIVAGTAFTSVVQSINTAYSGGSSNVFNREFHAAFDNICTSSKI